MKPITSDFGSCTEFQLFEGLVVVVFLPKERYDNTNVVLAVGVWHSLLCVHCFLCKLFALVVSWCPEVVLAP